MPPLPKWFLWGQEMRPATEEDAKAYILRVKEHFKHDKGKYTELLHLLASIKSRKIDPEMVILKMNDLLKDDNSLICGLNIFLPEDYVPKNRSQVKQRADVFSNKVQRVFQNEIHIYQKFRDILSSFKKGEKTMDHVYWEVKSLFRHNKCLFNEFTKFLPDSCKGSEPPSHLQKSARSSSGDATVPSSSKENFLNKQNLDLDPSQSERCTPSYRFLRENDPKSVSRYLTDLGREVLNNKLISVPMTCSSEHDSQEKLISRYERSLFICENDRYELDMLIEPAIDTLKHIQNLLEKIRNNSIKGDGHIQIEEYLTAMNLRCIKKLYGEKVLDLMDGLRKDPGRVLPVIQNRLQQKQAEYMKCRDALNKKWANTYAKNYKRSLHRSCEQQDRP